MSYCVAIKLNDGLVFASDSRTNAGLDHVNTYSKMFTFHAPDERMFVILTAGNLATTQAVINTLQHDFEDPDAPTSLRTVDHMFEAAHLVGELNRRETRRHGDGPEQGTFFPEASFILGGQIKGQAHEIFMIYPQGNYITASPANPYLQIGENKYGKPILDRIISLETSLEDAARCALVSLDSTMRSNVSVGPPFELALYRRDALEIAHYLNLKLASPLYKSLQKGWNEGLRRAFNRLPRFDWEGDER
jgi:putative proteasome-type protease